MTLALGCSATLHYSGLQEQTFNMKTFLFIHGSWHSAWNWHKIVPLLENAGHKVIAIDLPGRVINIITKAAPAGSF